MPRLYREAPLNSIWEGSGNVMALDVLRALARGAEPLWRRSSPRSTQAAGADPRLDAFVAALRAEFADLEAIESRARRVVERMALALQGSLLVRHAPAGGRRRVLRLAPGRRRGPAFGTLPAGRRRRGDHRAPHAAAALSAAAPRLTAGAACRCPHARLRLVDPARAHLRDPHRREPELVLRPLPLIYLLSGYFRDVLGGSSTEAYLVAVAAALLFFVSLVLHELGHALVARRNGIGIAGIDLWFFGGVAKMLARPRTPGRGVRVAAAGPAVTLADRRRSASALGALISRDERRPRRRGAASDAEAIAGDRAARLAGLDQRASARLQPRPRLPAGRRAHRARRRLEDHRRPQPRHALRGAARPGLRLRADRLRHLPARRAATRSTASGSRSLGWFLGAGRPRRGRPTAFTRAPRGRHRRRRHGRAAGVDARRRRRVRRRQEEFFLRYRWPWFPVVDDARALPRRRAQPSASTPRSRGGRPGARGRASWSSRPTADGWRRRPRPPAGDAARRRAAARARRAHGGRRRRRLRGVVTVEQVRRALTPPAAAGQRLRLTR